MLILRFAYIEVMVRWHDACSVVDLINYALVLQQQQLNVRTDLFFFFWSSFLFGTVNAGYCSYSLFVYFLKM